MPTETVRAYIALGSNLGDPHAQVTAAVSQLASLPETHLLRTSPWYRSAAVGPGDQPDYINGAVSVETTLSATALFAELEAIEAAHGRERRVRWAARTLDLDILLYGREIIATDRLTIPHPRLTERNFVIYPLSDIEPDLVLPGGESLRALRQQCSAAGLQPWPE